jgi:hypothetical protein
VPAAIVIATAKLKAVRITVSPACLEVQPIHPGFNLLSQRKPRKARNYRLFAGKMVNAPDPSMARFVAIRAERSYLT